MRSFLNLDNYDFLLPRELIASKPSEVRGNSRLLVLEREIKDRTIDNLVDYLDSGDLLVINDPKEFLLNAKFLLHDTALLSLAAQFLSGGTFYNDLFETFRI